MREQIILAPGCNGTELLRTLAGFGRNQMGLRIVNAAELAKMALIRSGICITKSYISRSQEASLVASFLKDEKEFPYFKAASYTDAVNLVDALCSLRSLITGDEATAMRSKLSGGDFPEKNQAVLSVYDRLMSEMEKAEAYDEIVLIRTAIESAKGLPADFRTLKEYPLSPLETKLLAVLSDGTFDPEKAAFVSDRFDENPKKQDIVLTKAYGASNEVEDIIRHIFENHLPLDTCTVVVTEPGYSQLFFELGNRYGIPITFGNGISISNTNPAKLLKGYVSWDGDGYHGSTALNSLVFGEFFDREKLMQEIRVTDRGALKAVVSIAGKLRLGRDGKENQKRIDAFEAVLDKKIKSGKSSKDLEKRQEEKNCIAGCRLLSAELCLEYGAFIRKYARITKGAGGRLDASAVRLIVQSIREYFSFLTDSSSGATGTLEEIARQIYSRTVDAENRKEGCLFVTGIGSALASVREHLFIAGLSADVFPGRAKENYLILDKDFELFADAATAPTSTNRILGKIDEYKHLKDLGEKLGLEIRLSYSGYDLSDLKEKNPSSVITEPVSREVGFFDGGLARSDIYGKEYLKGTRLSCCRPEPKSYEVADTEDKAYAPTVIEDYFTCPRKFMLSRILGLSEPEEDDPMEVMDGKQFGSLMHTAMEHQVELAADKQAFMKAAEELFDDFVKEYVPVQMGMEANTKRRFLRIAESAFDHDPQNRVEKAEEKIEVTHDCGLKLKGYPDRVEETPEKTYIIPDFKTGKKLKHSAEDIESCIQVAIYAYIMEKNGTPISKGEYRYLALQKVIPFTFDEEAKEKLNEKLSGLKTALDKGDFPRTPSDESCQYCFLAGLCGNADIAAEDMEAENEDE